MQEQDNNLFSDLSIDESAKKNIAGIASWAMIIVIVAVIGYVIEVISLFTAGSSPVDQSEGFGAYLRVGSEGAGSKIFAIVIGVVLNYFLYRFAVLAKKGLATNGMDDVSDSFRNLKIYFAIYSILVIIVSLLILLAIVAVL
ncbi:MAG TPA: hypothetical protein VF476_05150 [Chitinophagaceae bacterium]